MTIATKLLLLGDTDTAEARPLLESTLIPLGATVVDVHAFEVGAVQAATRVTDISEVRDALIAAANADLAIYTPWVQDLGCPHKCGQLFFVATLVGVDVYVGRPPTAWQDSFGGDAAESWRAMLGDLAHVGQDVLASAGSDLLLGEVSAFLGRRPSDARQSPRSAIAPPTHTVARPDPASGHRLRRAVATMRRAGMTDGGVASVLNTLRVGPPQGRSWTARRVHDYHGGPQAPRPHQPPMHTD